MLEFRAKKERRGDRTCTFVLLVIISSSSLQLKAKAEKAVAAEKSGYVLVGEADNHTSTLPCAPAAFVSLHLAHCSLVRMACFGTEYSQCWIWANQLAGY